MKQTFLVAVVCGLILIAGCTASQSSLYSPRNGGNQWNISATKSSLSGVISIAINDSIVVADKPAAFSNTVEGKGTFQGREVHFFSVYNNGILGIFGTGWETTVLVDKELAARFKL